MERNSGKFGELWCSYCKEAICDNTPYIVENDVYYHVDCYQQMNTFIDPFGDNLDYDSEE